MSNKYQFDHNDVLDPRHPRDAFGQPLDVGDWIVYPVKSGSSAASFNVGRIAKVVFKREWTVAERTAAYQAGRYLNGYCTCEPDEAEWHILQFHSARENWRTGKRSAPDTTQKVNTLQNVWNAVKVNADAVEASFKA